MDTLGSMVWWIVLFGTVGTVSAGPNIPPEELIQWNTSKTSSVVMVQRYIPNIPNAVETILTGPSLSLDLPRIDDFLKGSSENAEKRFMRMGITPEGMLNVKNTPSTNTSNTYENTSSSVVNDFKLAINTFLSMPVGNGKLSVVRNGLNFQLPLSNGWNTKDTNGQNIVRYDSKQFYMQLTPHGLSAGATFSDGWILKFQTGTWYTGMDYSIRF